MGSPLRVAVARELATSASARAARTRSKVANTVLGVWAASRNRASRFAMSWSYSVPRLPALPFMIQSAARSAPPLCVIANWHHPAGRSNIAHRARAASVMAGGVNSSGGGGCSASTWNSLWHLHGAAMRHMGAPVKQ